MVAVPEKLEICKVIRDHDGSMVPHSIQLEIGLRTKEYPSPSGPSINESNGKLPFKAFPKPGRVGSATKGEIQTLLGSFSLANSLSNI